MQHEKWLWESTVAILETNKGITLHKNTGIY